MGTNIFWYQSFGGVSDPKYPKIVMFVFVILRICIFVHVFVFWVLEKAKRFAPFLIMIGFVLGFVNF